MKEYTKSDMFKHLQIQSLKKIKKKILIAKQ